MPTQTLRVIAILEAKPEKIAELRLLLRGLIGPTREEPGCIQYELLENKEVPTQFVFVEEWRDESALEAHFKTEHMKRALERTPELLGAELDLRKYILVG